MVWLVMLIVLVAAAVTQAMAPPSALLGHAKPPCLLAVVLYYALTRDTRFALVSGLLAGILQDSMSPMPLGYSPAVFCVAGCVVGLSRRVVMTDSVFARAVLGAIVGPLIMAVFYLLLARRDLTSWPLPRLAIRAVGAGVLGMMATPVVWFVAELLDRAVGNTEAREEKPDEADLPDG